MTRSRYLGIDPGTNVMGWAVLECPANVLGHGVLKVSESSLSNKLREIFRFVADLVAEHNPDVCVLERSFAGLNYKSHGILENVRGVIMLAFSLADKQIKEISPRQAKSFLSGYGNASKEQMCTAARLRFKLSSDICADEADALALALSGLIHQ